MFKSKGSYVSLNNSDLSNKIDIIKNEFIKNKNKNKYQRACHRKKIFKTVFKYIFITLILFLISMLVFSYIFKKKYPYHYNNIPNMKYNEKVNITNKNNKISENAKI